MGAAGMVRNIIEETRASDRTQVTEADEGRQFYQLHPFKRIVIMFAGPFMNLILAVGIFGDPAGRHRRADPEHHGQPPSAHASSRPRAVPAEQRTECAPGDPATPGRRSPACSPATRSSPFDGAPVTELGPAHRR